VTPRVHVATAALVAAVLAGAVAHATGPQQGSVGPRPNVGPSDRPIVEPAAVARGARVWSAECVTCHGATARGSEQGPTLIRSLLVLRDRRGSELGPFLRKGHPTQSGRPSAAFTDAEVADIMQFVRQRINDTLRGSPVFVPGNILTGSAAAGETYFAGAGGCTACHSVTGDLRGLASRYTNPVDLQQRMLFPVAGRAGGRGATTATISRATGPAITGIVVADDDFFITVRQDSGAMQTARKGPGVKVVTRNPLQAHHEWLDRVSDANIHDLVAYLVTLK
jgi:cytochrome c oxidase cbb3-type subunit 3